LVLLKMLQDFLDRLPCLFGNSAPAEAVAELPCLVIKLRVAPTQCLNAPVPEDEEILAVLGGPPA